MPPRHADTAAATWRIERGRLVGAAARLLSDLDEAEDCAQDALLAAPALQVEPLGGRVSRHDEETDLWGSQQDFSIWLARQG